METASEALRGVRGCYKIGPWWMRVGVSELARCDWKVDARVMDDGEVCWWMIVLDIFD
jgi:hypothetical protein